MQSGARFRASARILLPVPEPDRVLLMSNLYPKAGVWGGAHERQPGARTLRRSLVVAQVAFTLVLIAGAGLLLASFRHALDVDPGFVAQGVLTGSVSLPRSRYPDDDARRAFAAECLRRVRALPGVLAAGATDTIPLGDQHNDSVILAEGYPFKPGESSSPPTPSTSRPATFGRWACGSCGGASSTSATAKPPCRS